MRLGGKYQFILKATTLAIAVGAAYSLGYWGNRPSPSQQTLPTQADDFVGFEPAEIDLGEQPWGEVIPVEFTFVNLGTEHVVIESLESCCGFAIVPENEREWEGRVVEPSETVALLANLHTQTRTGPRTRSITAVSDSGERYTARVEVDVQGTWSIEPDTLDFGNVYLDGESEPDPLLVTFASQSDVFLGVEVPDAPWLDCLVAERGEGVTELLFPMNRRELAPGVSTASVVVKTDNPVKPAGVVYVRARGAYRLVACPSEVFLVGAEPSVVRFTDETGSPVRLASVEVDNDGIWADCLAGTGQLRVTNPSKAKFREAVAVRVVDHRGIQRTIYVSAF
jgi:hypothetical protein